MSNDKISIDASEFVDIMLDSKSLDGIMDYINFDITQQEFDQNLKDKSLDFKILGRHYLDNMDGIRIYVYKYQIEDEIYKVYVTETGFISDAGLDISVDDECFGMN